MSMLRKIISVSTAVVIAAACSSSSDEDEESGASGDPLQGTDAFTDVGINQGSTGPSTGSGTSGGATGGPNSMVDGCADPNLDGCVGSNYEGEGLPLAIYIMFDQSASMDCVIEAQQPWQSDQCN